MKTRLLAAFILLAYALILIKIMVFKDIPSVRLGAVTLKFGGAEDVSGPANFWPFTTIVPYLLGDKGWFIAGINLAGNLVPLMPVGFLTPLAYPRMSWKKSLVLGVASGLTIELMQTVLHLGIFDIDDVILNAFGVMIGYGVFVTLTKWVRARNYKNIVIAAIIVMVVVATAFYAIYPKGQTNFRAGAGGVQTSSIENTR